MNKADHSGNPPAAIIAGSAATPVPARSSPEPRESSRNSPRRRPPAYQPPHRGNQAVK
jgi:hypothetical protein